MKRMNLTLSIAAGLFGGVLSHYLFTAPSVNAQIPAPREVRAQSFTLVNERGEIGGAMAFDEQGRPMIRLFYKGREIFNAGGITVRPLGSSGMPASK